MRILVAAPYPPDPDAAALEAVRTVERFVAQGHEVEVLSPLPSAAGRHAPLAGLRGAVTLARQARRFDALYLLVGRHMLFRPEVPGAGSTPELTAPAPTGAPAPPPELPAWKASTPPDWADLMAQVRARAARDRDHLEAAARRSHPHAQ